MKMKASASIAGPIGIAVFLSLILAASAVDATTVNVDPASQTVAAGDAFYMNITVENVDDLKGYAATLNFDPDVMQVTGITEGAFLKTGGTTMPISSWNNVTGTATFASALGFFDLWTTVSGSGILATIKFDTYPGTPADTYDLTLTNVEIRDADKELIPTDVVDGMVTITSSTATSTRTSTHDGGGRTVVVFDATGEGTADVNITDTIDSTPATTTPTTTIPKTITNVSANATTDTPASTPSSVPGLSGIDAIAAICLLAVLFAIKKRKWK